MAGYTIKHCYFGILGSHKIYFLLSTIMHYSSTWLNRHFTFSQSSASLLIGDRYLSPFLHGAELDVYLVSDAGVNNNIHPCLRPQVWWWSGGLSDLPVCQDQPEIFFRMFCRERVCWQMRSYQEPLSVFWASVWYHISVQVFNHCRKGVHHVIIYQIYIHFDSRNATQT